MTHVSYIRHKDCQLLYQILIEIMSIADKSLYLQYVIVKRGDSVGG
jgi:hypothetical protein